MVGEVSDLIVPVPPFALRKTDLAVVVRIARSLAWLREMSSTLAAPLCMSDC